MIGHADHFPAPDLHPAVAGEGAALDVGNIFERAQRGHDLHRGTGRIHAGKQAVEIYTVETVQVRRRVVDVEARRGYAAQQRARLVVEYADRTVVAAERVPRRGRCVGRNGKRQIVSSAVFLNGIDPVDQTVSGQLAFIRRMRAGRDHTQRIADDMQRRLANGAAVVENTLAVHRFGEHFSARIKDGAGRRKAARREQMRVRTIRRPCRAVHGKLIDQDHRARKERQNDRDQRISALRRFIHALTPFSFCRGRA